MKNAAQEERFTRKKHDPSFPFNALNWILNQNRLDINDLDYIAYYENPDLKFDRIMFSHTLGWPASFKTFKQAMLSQSRKLSIATFLKDKLGYDQPIFYCQHHLSHAASAFYPSPFEDAAFLTVDGVGEYETTTFGTAHGNDVEILQKIDFPHSLGLLYSAFTFYTGFKINSGEYKLMGLAPYGEAKYTEKIRDHLIDIREDGSFRLDMAYFDHLYGERAITAAFEDLFGRKHRSPETELTQFEMDIAASIQAVLEEVLIKICAHVRKQTEKKNLCLAGGVALNCVANGKIKRTGIFEDIWIQPAAGDAGGALGAALYYSHSERGVVRAPCKMMSPYLGPMFSDDEIRKYLDRNNIAYRYVDDVAKETARLLSEGNIIGWFQGKMEFGPRALGSRSILGDARSPGMQKDMNLKIKFRESFRPFAPIVLEEKASDWFDLEGVSPYMLIVSDVVEARRIRLTSDQRKLFGIDKLNVVRSDIPAVTHVDYSARIQTVNRDLNPTLYALLCEFDALTGCPVLVNTSFNVRGEPIVLSPEEAYQCFMRTGIDHLVLGRFVLDKAEQPEIPADESWKHEFELD